MGQDKSRNHIISNRKDSCEPNCCRFLANDLIITLPESHTHRHLLIYGKMISSRACSKSLQPSLRSLNPHTVVLPLGRRREPAAAAVAAAAVSILRGFIKSTNLHNQCIPGSRRSVACTSRLRAWPSLIEEAG